MQLPILESPLFVNDLGKAMTLRGGLRLNDLQLSLLRRVLLGDAHLETLASSLKTASESDPGRTLALVRSFLEQTNAIRIVDWDLPADAIIVDRGWQGVYQHSVDLWQGLNQRGYRTLLIAPTAPPFGFDDAWRRHLITPELLGVHSEHTDLAFFHLARSFSKLLNPRLVMLSHRALLPYFFDISAPAISHGDAYFDNYLGPGSHMSLGFEGRDPLRVLQNLLYFQGTPSTGFNLESATAAYVTSSRLKEIWFYTQSQWETGARWCPDLVDRFRVVPPLVDIERFCPANEATPNPVILFSTTNPRDRVGLKGLDPVYAALTRLHADVQLRIVVSDADNVPINIRANPQVEVLARVPKSQMLAIYRSARVYCRISKNDSSPVSVLEAMATGLPVMVSPMIAENLPFIVDGYNGFVVDPDDSEQIHHKLSSILSSEAMYRQFSDRARVSVQPFSIQRNFCLLERYLGVPTR